MLGIAFIERNGRRTLTILTAFKLALREKNSRRPIIATPKSITFHPFLKYDLECKINPLAIILRIDSTTKIMVKDSPILVRT